MSTYMYKNTKLPQYLPMPKFLTELPLSNTERYIYTLLLNRAQYSQMNGMVDEQGKVYIFYPIHQLSEKSGKDSTTVKSAIKHLIEVGILEKVSEGKGRANHLYLLFPDEEVGQKTDVGKKTGVGRKTVLNYGGNLTTSKYKSKNNNNPLRDYDYDEKEILLPENFQRMFQMKSHPRFCACRRAEHEREERERKEREHIYEVEKNTSVCFTERAMTEWNFENDNGSNSCIKYAKQYVEKWDETYKKGLGLLLWGDVGTGKSYMAACIANALLEQEKRVLMTNFSTISNGIYASADKNTYIAAICSYDLLIIDDLGSERSSSYMMENVFQVIDRRVCSGKPMIITTNLTVQEMRETQNLDEKRIYDRVLECCQPICVKGENHRREKSKQNRSEFEQIFQE